MRAFLSLGLAALLWLLPGVAAAELSAGVFGGHNLPIHEDGDDLFRWGFGARAGMTFVLPIYVGLAATFHSGSADDEEDVPRNYLNYYGAEVGVDLTFGSFGLRPYAMGGAADVHTSRDRDGGFISPYIGLGVMPTWRLLDLPAVDLLLGLDLRGVHVLRLIDNGDNAGSANGLAFFLSLGARV